jgi:hypothetical protein
MTDAYSGGCACGEIRYSCSGEPLYMGNCHCRDCQRATGSAFFPAVLFKGENFTLEQGEPRWYDVTADSGVTMRRAFCASCGSPVFIENGARPGNRVLYAGSLDDPSRYEPSRNIYTASAQTWGLMHPDLPKDDGMPGR